MPFAVILFVVQLVQLLFFHHTKLGPLYPILDLCVVLLQEFGHDF